MPELSKLKLTDGVTYDLKDTTARASITTLTGRVTTLESKIQYDTTANWNAQLELIAQRGTFYVYSDHSVDENDNPVPGIKIGDGSSYLIDMPFVDMGGGGSGGITVYIDPNNAENVVFIDL